jgi:hypothetical protein
MKELNDYLVFSRGKGMKPAEALAMIRRARVKKGKTYFVAGGYKGVGDAWVQCYHCGKLLTDGLSRLRGCGPVCLEKHGEVPGRNIKDVKGLYRAYLRYADVTGFKPLSILQWIPKEDFTKKQWECIQEQICDIRCTEV